MRRYLLALTLAAVLSLLGASGAQAVVLNDNGNYAGVALVHSTTLPGGVTAVTSGGPCTDPWLSPDLVLPSSGLCWNGGAVMHGNETFELTWDASTIAPYRRSWPTTRYYVQQFLKDVADGNGSLGSPYADASQYNDTGGRARNASVYGGGCIDYGNRGGYTCQLGNSTGSGAGNDYPANGCPVTGQNQWYEGPGGSYGVPAPNDICLTDAQIQGELQSTLPGTGIIGHTQPGYTPLVVLMTPPGVEVCLDSAGSLCSANGSPSAPFCSYHSQVNVNGTQVAYLVQPWTAAFDQAAPLQNNGCDETHYVQDDKVPNNPLPDWNTLAIDVGKRLVSPLSQAQIAAITDPGLNGWYSLNGFEINDNGGCQPEPKDLDLVTVGNSSQNQYYLQREFNNAGVMESAPNAPTCTPIVNLVPKFVAPSGVNQGDVVALDGSKTDSTLIVPKAFYQWSFGDGTTAIGPSVVHSYGRGGTYTVTLTTTDRGGNVASTTQTITVLGPSGQIVAPPTTQPGAGSAQGLRAMLQLLPQSLRSVLRGGLTARVSSNQVAAGIASIWLPRRAARRAHIKGRGPLVLLGRGSVSVVRNGAYLRVHLSHGLAAKLARLGHVTLTVRLSLVGSGGSRITVDAAGRY